MKNKRERHDDGLQSHQSREHFFFSVNFYQSVEVFRFIRKIVTE